MTIGDLEKILMIVVSVGGAVIWVVREIRTSRKEAAKGLEKIEKKVVKIDKHKVSYKSCDQRRAECPCRAEYTKKG